jgi:hypothetical protein
MLTFAPQFGGAEVEAVGLPVAEEFHRPGGAAGVDQFDAGAWAEAAQADVDPIAAVVGDRHDAVVAVGVVVGVVALKAVGAPVGMGRIAAAHFIGVVSGFALEKVVITPSPDAVVLGGADDRVVALAADDAHLVADQGDAGEIEPVRLPVARQIDGGGGDAPVAVIDGGGVDDLLNAGEVAIDSEESNIDGPPAHSLD